MQATTTLEKAVTEEPVKARAVSLEEHHEVEQFLYREARLLDTDRQREWLDTMVDPDVHYQVFSRQLRYRKDKRGSGDKEVYIYDDRYGDLDARTKLFETGLQWTADPQNRLRHLVSNVEVFAGERDGEYQVYSNCVVSRNRLVYEEMTYFYGREDVIRRGPDGQLRLLKRVIDYDQRFIRGKNLLFIL